MISSLVLILILIYSFIINVYSNNNNYNKWRITQEEPFTDISSFELDENNRLMDHWIVYSDHKDCKATVEIMWRRGRYEYRRAASIMTGSSLNKIFISNENETVSDINNDSTTCNIACLTKGTPGDLISSPLYDDVFKIDLSNSRSIVEAMTKCQSVEAGFISYHDNPLTLFWVNIDNGELIDVGKIKRGERFVQWQTTTLGHRFKAIDDITDDIIDEYIVTENAWYVIGDAGSKTVSLNNTLEIKNTFVSEWNRSRRVKRTFTELGFEKGRLPDDLWGSISAYYYNNRNKKVREEWEDKGFFVNWWEYDAYMIGMPWQLKRYWQKRLMTLVERWSGVSLELTDIYGMRRYERGARLLTHVDREDTHAASLIINVAQGNVNKPWPVEIYDFADRLHEIEMNEGDIVYYESAKCLHGRMAPLDGEFYVNLFAHYRPIGEPKWHQKPNPADAPKQLLNIGECESNGTKVTKCSELDAPLPYLSPSLEKLTGPLDLFNHWLKFTMNVDNTNSNSNNNKNKETSLKSEL
jgi:hypothetical protein